MKKVRKTVYCPRCGGEISAEESALLQGAACALCAEMQLEAQMIHAQRLNRPRPLLTIVGPVDIKLQLPHPRS